MDPASPQRDALPRAPTLDLTLPEALDERRQEEESEGGEDGDVDSDVDGDGEEEERSKEEEVFRSEAGKAVLMEIKRREEGPESLRWPEAKLKEMAREFVHGLRLWRDLRPRRVQALVSCEGSSSDETQLSFKPDIVMTEVRPAAWMRARWLEGTLDGRIGLIYGEDVKYLD